MKKIVTSLMLALAFMVCAVPAYAAKVSPMIAELKPSGRNSVLRVTVTNTSERDIPYEVRMVRGEITPDGQLETTPAEEDFLVFPAQSIIEGQSQQVFRVQYIGEPLLDQSQVYYMSIRQVPVANQQSIAQVLVSVNYNVLINIVPNGSRPMPTVTAIENDMRDEVAGLKFEVGNAGTRFFNAGLSKWTVTGETDSGQPYEVEYKSGELSRFIGVGVVAPGKMRRFFLPTEVALKPETVTIEIAP